MAVSVKDFLDAIRGRYQDEPNKVEVTGSVVEKYEMANQIEIRNTGRHFFSVPEEIANQYKNFEIYITDTHVTSAGDRVMPDMNFAIADQRAGNASYIDDAQNIVRWGVGTSTNAVGASYLEITRKSYSVSMVADRLPLNVSLTSMLEKAEVDNSGSLKPGVIEDRERFISFAKNVFINITPSIGITYLTTPVSGSITIKYVGWK